MPREARDAAREAPVVLPAGHSESRFERTLLGFGSFLPGAWTNRVVCMPAAISILST